MIEPFLGPDIALWSSHFICKPPGHGRAAPWHEDSNYWRGMLEPQEVITVWLAIDESSRENGCMRVIPGSHGHGFSEPDPTAGAGYGLRIIKRLAQHVEVENTRAGVVLTMHFPRGGAWSARRSG